MIVTIKTKDRKIEVSVKMLCVFACLLLTTVGAVGAVEPVKLIIDTDIGGGGCRDVDDVAAVCIGNALADMGEAE